MNVKIRMCFLLFLVGMGISLSVVTASAYQGETAGEMPIIEETSVVGTTLDAADTENPDSDTGNAAGSVSAGGEAGEDGEQLSTGGTVLDETASSAGRDSQSGENQVVGTTQGGRTGETPFSIPGNGLLLDDKSEDGTKQFLTIRTKNGNTFFMVLDRSNNTENVYMLSMIDEEDLAEFIGDTKEQSKSEVPSLVIPQKETSQTMAGSEPDFQKNMTEPENEKAGGMNTGPVLVIVVLAVVGIGGLYYFKVMKPKRDEEDAEVEDLEFYDGGAYINEDAEDLRYDEEEDE